MQDPPQLSSGRGCPAASRDLGVGGMGGRVAPGPTAPGRGRIQMNGPPPTPYLHFPGTAREALTFYGQVFG